MGRRCGRAFVYNPVARRDVFLEDVTRQTVAGLVTDFGAPAIAGFVDAVDELAPEKLEMLRQEIEHKIGETAVGPPVVDEC